MTETIEIVRVIDSPLLTATEAMAYLRISRPTLQRHAASGALRRTRLGSRVFFHRDDLDSFIDAGRGN